MNEVRIFATRSAGSGSQLLCGACGIPVADGAGGLLQFLADAEEAWQGWIASVGWQRDAPGGLWEAAPTVGPKQPPLGQQLEMLPAIVECPDCTAGNLFDPERLVLRPNQFVARAHALVRQAAST